MTKQKNVKAKPEVASPRIAGRSNEFWQSLVVEPIAQSAPLSTLQKQVLSKEDRDSLFRTLRFGIEKPLNYRDVVLHTIAQLDLQALHPEDQYLVTGAMFSLPLPECRACAVRSVLNLKFESRVALTTRFLTEIGSWERDKPVVQWNLPLFLSVVEVLFKLPEIYRPEPTVERLSTMFAKFFRCAGQNRVLATVLCDAIAVISSFPFDKQPALIKAAFDSRDYVPSSSYSVGLAVIGEVLKLPVEHQTKELLDIACSRANVSLGSLDFNTISNAIKLIHLFPTRYARDLWVKAASNLVSTLRSLRSAQQHLKACELISEFPLPYKVGLIEVFLGSSYDDSVLFAISQISTLPLQHQTPVWKRACQKVSTDIKSYIEAELDAPLLKLVRAIPHFPFQFKSYLISAVSSELGHVIGRAQHSNSYAQILTAIKVILDLDLQHLFGTAFFALEDLSKCAREPFVLSSVDLIEEFPSPYIERLTRYYMDSKYASVQLRAIANVPLLEEQPRNWRKACRTLCKLLNSDNANVRMRAANLVGIFPPNFDSQLVNAIYSSRYLDARQRAIFNMVRLDG